ncbi:MAG: DUF2157 domain-containing protein [Opitutaceae bacterium]|jgi:hypothetical protein|nr:DUF2157 domain-containing protein [Opitutaceae bacterium]
MQNSKFAARLLEELPALESGKIVTPEVAEALRRHYAPHAAPGQARPVALVISALLGGLLIGAGIILLAAHNWDELGRPARTVLSLAPLAAGIALAFFAQARRPGSAAWREGGGVFYFLAIGASIALISQTYHLYNDFLGFLLVWTTLSLALVYLLGSGAVFFGFLACVVWRGFEVADFMTGRAPGILQAWLWLLAALPFYGWHVWKRREAVMTSWLSLAIALAVPLLLLATAFGNEPVFSYLWPVAFASVFALFYLFSRVWFGEVPLFRNPFRALGSLGVAVLAVVLSFKYVFNHVFGGLHESHVLVAGVIFAVLAVCLVMFGPAARRRAGACNWAAAAFPLAVVLATAMADGGAAAVVMNLYALALGGFTLARGVRRGSMAGMNEGALLLAVLAACRFFDSDISFVVRSVAFIVIGAGFLGANLWFLSRRKNKQKGPA